MRGGGFYDANSSGQRSAMDVFLPWLVDAVAEIPLPEDGSPIVLLDLGSSEGGNAIHAVRAIIEALRKRTKADVWTFFDDLPSNDFNQLFANLFPGSARALGGSGVYPAAIGGSLYERVAPTSSLHLATTFNALGWMSTLPAMRLPQFVSPMAPSPSASEKGVSVSEEEHAPFARQAREDMNRFYRARAAELRTGGKLLVQVFGRNEEYSTANGIVDGLNDVLLDMVRAGRIGAEAYEDFVFPVFYRSVEELLSPIAQGDASPEFRVDKAEARECEVPFNEEFARTGDRRAWAESYVGFIRAFSEPVVASRLPETEDRPELVAEVYGRMVDRFAADPDRYEFHYISLGALLTRL